MGSWISNSILSEPDWLKGWWFLGVCVFWFLEQDVGTFVLLSEDRLHLEIKTHRELNFPWDHLVVWLGKEYSMLVQGYLRLWKLVQTLVTVREHRDPGALHLPQQENTQQQAGCSNVHGGNPGLGRPLETTSLRGCGDGLIRKVIAFQPEDPQTNSTTHLKMSVWQHEFIIAVQAGGDRRMSGTHWPASLS